VSGRVVHLRGADSLPVPGVWAVLHQVTLESGGPVDSVRTDTAGRYRVRAAKRDTAAVYIVSVTYDGIAYFTRPIHVLRGTRDSAEALAVFDTSSTAPRIELAQRHLIVRRPEQDGSHHVLELLVLRNSGSLTRIAPDTSRPVWQGMLPAGAIQFEVGESDVASDAVYRRGDSIAVAAPLPPGQKQVLVSYVLPSSARRLALRLGQPVSRMNILVEDSTAVLEGGGFSRVGSESIQGERFLRFTRDDVPPGTSIAVRFAGRPLRVAGMWWLVVGVAAAALGGGLVLAWQRTRTPALARATVTDPAVLAAEIAALDAAFEARADATFGERAAYERHRAELKARLEELLAHPPA
jgi:hypothetical protein